MPKSTTKTHDRLSLVLRHLHERTFSEDLELHVAAYVPLTIRLSSADINNLELISSAASLPFGDVAADLLSGAIDRALSKSGIRGFGSGGNLDRITALSMASLYTSPLSPSDSTKPKKRS